MKKMMCLLMVTGLITAMIFIVCKQKQIRLECVFRKGKEELKP